MDISITVAHVRLVILFIAQTAFKANVLHVYQVFIILQKVLVVFLHALYVEQIVQAVNLNPRHVHHQPIEYVQDVMFHALHAPEQEVRIALFVMGDIIKTLQIPVKFVQVLAIVINMNQLRAPIPPIVCARIVILPAMAVLDLYQVNVWRVQMDFSHSHLHVWRVYQYVEVINMNQYRVHNLQIDNVQLVIPRVMAAQTPPLGTVERVLMGFTMIHLLALLVDLLVTQTNMNLYRVHQIRIEFVQPAICLARHAQAQLHRIV